MALLVCRDCSTAFAVGLSWCPQCTSTNCVEEGQEVPKITVHGGPTNVNAEPGQPGYVEPAERRELLAELTQEAIDAGSYGEPAPPAEVEKPAAKRARKPRTRPAGDAVAELSVTAEAEVTRP